MGRSRRRSGGWWTASAGWKVAVFTLIVALLVTVQPALTVTEATMGREASIDVVRDEDGGMGLSVYENFQHDTPVPLVDITNNFDAPMTVTVTLVQYNSNDDHLYVDGSDVGDTYTVQLTSGETETIDLLAERRCFWWFCFPSNIAFEVSATVQGTDARATRSISIGAYQ